MTVHRVPICDSLSHHVHRTFEEHDHRPEALGQFVDRMRREYSAERALIGDLPLADLTAPRREWTESELRFADGDR